MTIYGIVDESGLNFRTFYVSRLGAERKAAELNSRHGYEAWFVGEFTLADYGVFSAPATK